MEIDALLQAISSVGFPIAVAVYLLIANDKLRGVIEKNTLAIAEMSYLIKSLRIPSGTKEKEKEDKL